MDNDTITFERLVDRYQAGAVPWDDPLPPPEVIDLLDKLEPGQALDLGCGPGRATIYMARQGWQVDGVDFVPQAIDEAARRMVEAGLRQQIRLHIASVADLSFLAGSYDLVLDVGCLHALDEVGQAGYRDGVRRLLRPNGRYLLFARLREGEDSTDGPRGMPETAVHALFAAGFVLEKMAKGETRNDENSVWASAWFWFRRQD